MSRGLAAQWGPQRAGPGNGQKSQCGCDEHHAPAPRYVKKP